MMAWFDDQPKPLYDGKSLIAQLLGGAPEPTQPSALNQLLNPPMMSLGSSLPGQNLTAYHPTWRDRVVTALGSDSMPQGGRDLLGSLFGSKGAGNSQFSVADLTPLGALFGAQEAVSQGDYKGAALAAMPMPGASRAARMFQEAGRPIASNLRHRYADLLERTPDGAAYQPLKDVDRIKLTPERVEYAKERLASELTGRAGPQLPAPQMLEASDFARAASAAGHDVRMKVPDGQRGSFYVRVGDHGTVRFADHGQPDGWVLNPLTGKEEYVQEAGGYSRDLGRRHLPPDVSVSPKWDDATGKYGMDSAPARDWLGRLPDQPTSAMDRLMALFQKP